MIIALCVLVACSLAQVALMWGIVINLRNANDWNLHMSAQLEFICDEIRRNPNA